MDDFFRHCWFYLKSKRPDLADEMKTIECEASGFRIKDAGKVEPAKTEESQENGQAEPNIL